MSFQAVLKHPLAFAKIVDILRKLVDAVTLDITKEGFNVVTVDSAQVFLIDLALNSHAAFTKFVCPQRMLSVSIKLETLHNVSKKFKRDDVVTMELDEDKDPDNIVIVVRTMSQGTRRTSTYTVAQVMITDQDRVEIPDRTYNCEVMLQASLLEEICKEMEGIGEQLEVSVDHDRLQFNVRSDVTVQANLVIEKQDAIGIVCNQPDSIICKFKFFFTMARAAKIQNATEVLLQIGKDQPLSLCFTMEDGTLNFYLAPMIEDS